MSTKYEHGKDVPTHILAHRLNELSLAVTKRDANLIYEFSMRIPAEVDRDADLVLCEAARRLLQFEAATQIPEGFEIYPTELIKGLQSKITLLKSVLEDANDLCRSAYQIADREGIKTSWRVFKGGLAKSLERQHKIMYPRQYDNCLTDAGAKPDVAKQSNSITGD